MVTVRFFAAAKAAAGTSELALELSSISDLIEQCAVVSQQLSAVISTCTFLVDGLAESDLERDLAGALRIDVLPKFAGG